MAEKARTFCVITGVPTLPDDRNCADSFIYVKTDTKDSDEPQYFLECYHDVDDAQMEISVECKVPVFQVGEVLILNDYGREIPYPGRKPSKWYVDYEMYDDLDAALERSRDVFENTSKDGKLPPTKVDPIGWQSGEMRRSETNLLIEAIKQTPKEKLLEKFPGMKPLVDALTQIGKEADERRSGGSENGEVDTPQEE